MDFHLTPVQKSFIPIRKAEPQIRKARDKINHKKYGLEKPDQAKINFNPDTENLTAKIWSYPKVKPGRYRKPYDQSRLGAS